MNDGMLLLSRFHAQSRTRSRSFTRRLPCSLTRIVPLANLRGWLRIGIVNDEADRDPDDDDDIIKLVLVCIRAHLSTLTRTICTLN